MSSTIQFPDQIYIEQIRQHIWSGREFGRAAVMVGAGFSRNAQKSVASIPEFPLWKDIAEKMFDALYPVGSSEETRRERSRIAMTSGAPLRLASEYEAAFTRPALDDLLLNGILDTGYQPGDLHRMLLSLPWADIFTTNYDTLLERTRQFIYDRKYDVVLDISDIPVASRPRIVKLHGSFPSQRPFIITEEDFRTYPNDFSPFVNLVQQSMMENVFCLLGFSGDDPNFLNWTGWVRDKLARHTQPIYLCGILSLSTFQRKLLEGRNVIPIDLSPLFPESSWLDPAVRFARALEWFLLALLYGEPANLVHWPKSVSRSIWTPSPNLPALVAGPSQLSPLGERSPKGFRRLATEELKSLYENWKRKREEYPGWVVLPNDNREQLWEYTKYWIVPIFRSLDQLSPPDDLFALSELNWRATALFTDAALNAARCIHAFSPALSLSIRLRVGKSPEEDNWLDLATVAGLNDEEVAYVYPVFRNSFIEALNHLTRHPEEVGGFLASTNFRRALAFSDLLSRLVPRLTEAQIEEILQIAVQVYLSPVVQSHHTLHKCQAILFKRALQSASSDHQIRVLPQLLALPLPGEGGFQVSSPDQWDDPFMSVSVRVRSRAISTIDRAAIDPSINNLIRLIANGNTESRWRAILRLSHLHEIGILTAEETEQFATALWSRLDETGLPAETLMRRNAILLLPEPSPGLAKDKLKTYLLSTDFYGRAKHDGAGNEGTSFALSFGTQDLILEWCNATAQVPLTDETPSSTLIDWSTDEVVVLLDKTISWWNDQKRFLTQADAVPLVADNLRADFDGLVGVLMKVIVPRLKVEDVENLKRAIVLIEELEQAGIVVLPVLPLLSVDSNLYNEVRHKIQSGLLSNDPIQVDGALLGLRDWLIYSLRGNLPSPPPYFLDQMIVFIAERRVIGLEKALMYMTDLLITVPNMFEERHLELILLGMTALIRETDLEGSVEDGFIDSADKPRVRRRAVKLANELWRRYQDLGKPIPEAIERWKIIGETDPLAFVRKAWKRV